MYIGGDFLRMKTLPGPSLYNLSCACFYYDWRVDSWHIYGGVIVQMFKYYLVCKQLMFKYRVALKGLCTKNKQESA